MNEEKVVVLKELEDELTRGLDHSSQRTDAEVKLRKMEADVRINEPIPAISFHCMLHSRRSISFQFAFCSFYCTCDAQIKALSNSNDTVRLFQEYDAARKKQDDLIATLRAELATAKSDAKRAAAVASASKANGNGVATIPVASSADGEKTDGNETLCTPGGASITTNSSSGKSPREIVLEVRRSRIY